MVREQSISEYTLCSPSCRWLAEQVTDPTITEALLQASRGQRCFSYSYNWALNAVSNSALVPLPSVALLVCSVLILAAQSNGALTFGELLV